MQIWDDSQKLSENCLASHAVFEEDCLSLNGRWRFLALKADQPLPEGYFQPTFSSKHWDIIPVPSSWEETGYTQGYFNGSKPAPTLFPHPLSPGEKGRHCRSLRREDRDLPPPVSAPGGLEQPQYYPSFFPSLQWIPSLDER